MTDGHGRPHRTTARQVVESRLPDLRRLPFLEPADPRDSQRSYRFSHPSFHEYLAASHLETVFHERRQFPWMKGRLSDPARTVEIHGTRQPVFAATLSLLGPQVFQHFLSILCWHPRQREQTTDLEAFYQLVFPFLTVQQYLYDGQFLDRAKAELAECYLRLWGRDTVSLRARTVCAKLYGHALYASADDDERKRALLIFDDAATLVRERYQREEGARTKAVWKWYLVFFLDHRLNRTGVEACGDVDRMAEAIEDLLPASLGGLGERPTSSQRLLTLRAAHFWGHRGNQVLQQIQRFGADIHRRVDRFVSVSHAADETEEYYRRAAGFRIAVLHASLPAVYVSVRGLLQRDDTQPVWLHRPGQQDRMVSTAESLMGPMQAVGDIANQYLGRAQTCLWHWAVLRFRSTADAAVSQALLARAGQMAKIGRELWHWVLEQHGEQREQVIRYYLRIEEIDSCLAAARGGVAGRRLYAKRQMQHLELRVAQYGGRLRRIRSPGAREDKRGAGSVRCALPEGEAVAPPTGSSSPRIDPGRLLPEIGFLTAVTGLGPVLWEQKLLGGVCCACARGERPSPFWWFDPVKSNLVQGTVADLRMVLQGKRSTKTVLIGR